jgi:hypothetical protein
MAAFVAKQMVGNKLNAVKGKKNTHFFYIYSRAALSHFCVRLFDPSRRVLKLLSHVTGEKRFTGRAHKDSQLLLIHPLIQTEFHLHPFFNLTKILIPGDTKEFRAASHENIARLATRFCSALLAFRPG